MGAAVVFDFSEQIPRCGKYGGLHSLQDWYGDLELCWYD